MKDLQQYGEGRDPIDKENAEKVFIGMWEVSSIQRRKEYHITLRRADDQARPQNLLFEKLCLFPFLLLYSLFLSFGL